MINDIKPDNIFLTGDGSIDIGDFGGATAIGDPLVETTPGYYPVDLSDAVFARPIGDWMCLINTIFQLLKKHQGNTVDEVRHLIAHFDGDEQIGTLLHVIEKLALH